MPSVPIEDVRARLVASRRRLKMTDREREAVKRAMGR